MAISYPKNKAENYAYRAKLLSEADKDPQFRAALYQMCKNDILFWINSFCWTYDPRTENQQKLGYKDAHILFLTWEFQDDYIKWLRDHIQYEVDGATEKSRDMGASWMVLVVVQWFWQFGSPGNDFLLGSRKEDFVDKLGDMDALFPKIRYQIKRQPEWLLPQGFSLDKHSSYMRIKNSETDSMITGESNNAYFGTGGRKKAVIFDEFAKWEHTDESAWQSASDVTGCKLAISSANGRNNHFYNLRAGKAGKIDVYRMHWSGHPLKDQKWYDEEKERRSPQDLAAEVDIDYTASISNKAWESFSYDRHVTSDKLYDENLPIILACDFNIEPMSWVLIHQVGAMSYVFGELVDPHRTRTEDHAKELASKLKNHKNKEIYLYGDASGKYGHTASKHSNYEIIKKILAEDEWNIHDYVPSSNPPVADRLNASNKRLRDWERKGESFVLIHESAVNLIDSLEQSRRKGDGIDKSDNVEHAAESWSYYEVAKYPVRDNKVTQKKLGGF